MPTISFKVFQESYIHIGVILSNVSRNLITCYMTVVTETFHGKWEKIAP